MINQNANNQPIHADEPPESVKAHTGQGEGRPSIAAPTSRQNVSTPSHDTQTGKSSAAVPDAAVGAAGSVVGGFHV